MTPLLYTAANTEYKYNPNHIRRNNMSTHLKLDVTGSTTAIDTVLSCVDEHNRKFEFGQAIPVDEDASAEERCEAWGAPNVGTDCDLKYINEHHIHVSFTTEKRPIKFFHYLRRTFRQNITVTDRETGETFDINTTE